MCLIDVGVERVDVCALSVLIDVRLGSRIILVPAATHIILLLVLS
jgi:hypothetical protein